MTPFASDEWVRQLDLALQHLALHGPALRVRYRFTLTEDVSQGGGNDRGVREIGYDLDLGDGARAHRSGMPGPADGPNVPGITVVTLTQPLALAAAVAAGEESAQRALLRGDITVAGDVTALLAWAPALERIDAAMAPLRSRTNWTA